MLSVGHRESRRLRPVRSARLRSPGAAAPLLLLLLVGLLGGCELLTGNREIRDHVALTMDLSSNTFVPGDTLWISVTLTSLRSEPMVLRWADGCWLSISLYDMQEPGTGWTIVPAGGGTCRRLERVTHSLAPHGQVTLRVPFTGIALGRGPVPPGSYRIDTELIGHLVVIGGREYYSEMGFSPPDQMITVQAGP